MFSTTDSSPSRIIRIEIEGPDVKLAVPVPVDLEAVARRAKTFPSKRSLRQIAIRTAEVERLRHGRIDRVRLQVVRTGYDPVDLEPRQVLIKEILVEIPSDRS